MTHYLDDSRFLASSNFTYVNTGAISCRMCLYWRSRNTDGRRVVLCARARHFTISDPPWFFPTFVFAPSSRLHRLWVLLDGRRCSFPVQGDQGQCWLQVHALLLIPTIRMMCHTYLLAVGSAKPCLCQSFLTLCASSHRAPPHARSPGQILYSATGRIDRSVFFASGWLVWLG